MRRFIIPILFFLLVLFAGTVGYMLIEGWGILDSIYMTVITLTTVGFGEPHPLSQIGTLFTIFLVVGGVVSVTMILGSLGRTIVEGEFKRLIWRQKVEKTIEQLSDHFVLCGFGQVGKEIVRSFQQVDMPFVVVEKEEAVVRQLELDGVPCVFGNATVEDVLLRAGIRKARGLVTALDNDADNVYVCLTVRSICPKIRIVARATDERAATNLKQAGADRVIAPSVLGGHQLAQACLRPAVLDFIMLATRRTTLDLQMEEILLNAPSDFIGKPLSETDLRSKYDVIVIAIQKPSGDMVFNPGFNHVLEEEDTLIVLGPSTSIQELGLRMG